jgi:hypothetical protein
MQLLYELDENLVPIPQKDAISPLKGRYLGNQEEIRARIEGVKVNCNCIILFFGRLIYR